jgi:hypothetical protein
MSRSATDREQELDAALDRLFDRSAALEKALKDAAQAESDYRIEYAKEFLKAEGTIDQRKHTAILAVEKLLRERDRTEAVKDFTKEFTAAARIECSARQSLLSADTRTNKQFA